MNAIQLKIQTEIKSAFQELKGLKLTRTTRAANMECLKFGINFTKFDDGEIYNIGLFALHLQCPWRILYKNKIFVGSSDLYTQANEKADYNEDFYENNYESNLRDFKLNKLTSLKNLFIKEVKINQFNEINIQFNKLYELTTFSESISKDSENWRLIDFRKKISIHYVSGSNGLRIGRS